MNNTTGKKIIILGNGAAGFSAAQEIRKYDTECNIIMISDEQMLSYRRPMLTKSIAKIPDLNEMLIQSETWYSQNKITIILNTSIAEINTSKKMISMADGTELTYDQCIYALGAESFIPPVQGVEKQGVFAIRKITDLWSIRQSLPDIKEVAIVGGGVLGLEAAWEFNQAGCHVTILERSNRLMPRQLDEDAGLLLANIIESKGILIKYLSDTAEIIGDQNVTGVLLKSGELIATDMIIFSTGVRANTTVAANSGLTINRGVVVNHYLQTNVPDVFACGDCAEYMGTSYKLWTEATAMGKVAGANSCGANIKYELAPPPLIFQGMNTTLFSIGVNGTDPDKSYHRVKQLNSELQTYEAFYFENEQLVGVIVVGSLTRFAELSKAVTEKKSLSDMNLS